MPQNITDASSWTTTVVAPANGDPVDGDGLEVLAQGLSNRTKRLRDAVFTIRENLGVLAAYRDYNVSGPRFTPFGGGSNGATWLQDSVATAGAVAFHLPHLPTVGTITAVRLVLGWGTDAGSGQHAASLPATKPQIQYVEHPIELVNLSSANADPIESTPVVDPSGTLSAYLNMHTIQISGGQFHANHILNLATARRPRYLVINGETGANSTPGLGLYFIEVDITP